LRRRASAFGSGLFVVLGVTFRAGTSPFPKVRLCQPRFGGGFRDRRQDADESRGKSAMAQDDRDDDRRREAEVAMLIAHFARLVVRLLPEGSRMRPYILRRARRWEESARQRADRKRLELM
jgi:hypothetical protein